MYKTYTCNQPHPGITITVMTCVCMYVFRYAIEQVNVSICLLVSAGVAKIQVKRNGIYT